MMKRDLINTLKGVLLGLMIVALGAISVQAWTAPTTNPPGGNVAAPLNVSSSAQTKQGRLGLGGVAPTAMLDVNGAVRIRGGNPGAGKILVSDANGVASWSTVAQQNNTICAWKYPNLTCDGGSGYRGMMCGEGEFASGVRFGRKECDGMPDQIWYTYAYCCPVVN
jgi:hypothetical protein